MRQRSPHESPGSPIARTRAFIRAIREERDLAGGLIAGLVVTFMLLSALLPVSSTVRDVGLARFHRKLPFELWATLQPWPAMYNFENVVYMGATPDPRIAPAHLQPPLVVNHHSTERVTTILRDNPPRPGTGCGFFLLVSSYEGQEMRTAYVACPVSESEYRMEEFVGEARP